MLDLYQIPLTEIAGIGPRKAKELASLGIRSAGELLEYYPYRYEDFRLRNILEAEDGEKLTLSAEVTSIPVVQRYGRKKSRLSCQVMSSGWTFKAVWFNQAFIKDQLQPGSPWILTGKWDRRRRQLTVSRFEAADKETTMAGTIQPVYPIGGKIHQTFMRRAICQGLLQYGSMIEERLPGILLDKHSLMGRKEAIRTIHDPDGAERAREAKRRLAYEELLLFQLKLMALRHVNHGKADGVRHEFDIEAVRSFVRGLPFQLTVSQKTVLRDILDDMQKPYTMNRLLQGDVGSGKTVVAAVALYANFLSGYQGAFMAPTEILAEQHARALTDFFQNRSMQISLLTGRMTEKQRKDVLASLQMGLTDIVVGTHALIQESVHFRRLGLVITDEQHRFGVNQRSVLRRKGFNPDVLSMTATPIPRTLAITAFGDLDVSSLRELPQGRKPIRTYWVKHGMLGRIIRFLDKEARAGRQAYVICPLIEESEKLDVQNAAELHAQLTEALPEWTVGLLHGRMPADEKDKVMEDFQNNRVQVLVSTTVVEVGVDVPNATVMVIHDADRFGLSQLHQLRGRVGRGAQQSYCILVADPASDTGRERMKIMTETTDGFEIARRDLQLRGPGDFFGTKQSGMPDFRVADLSTDFELLETARDDAAELLSVHTFWTAAEYLPLRSFLHREGIFGEEALD